LDRYAVKLFSRAYRDLDGIYAYIAETLMEPGTTQKLLDALEETIFGLEELPQRGAPRKNGAYAKKGYRQLFIKNFTVVYRVHNTNKQVVVVTVRYSKRQFCSNYT
jgi:toxin ParE1/3/4